MVGGNHDEHGELARDAARAVERSEENWAASEERLRERWRQQGEESAASGKQREQESVAAFEEQADARQRRAVADLQAHEAELRRRLDRLAALANSLEQTPSPAETMRGRLARWWRRLVRRSG